MKCPCPRVAVVIAAYNAEGHVQNAIRSLDLDLEPHDIIVVDDGSNRPVVDVITPQENLIILRSEFNIGPAGARNIGLRYVLENEYEYVAILDSDDTAPPERLMLQRLFLDQNIDVGVVGSWIKYVDENGSVLSFLRVPTDRKSVMVGLYYNNCIFSDMYRVEALRVLGLYRECLAEDYELVRRIARGYGVACVPYFAYNYTVSPFGISHSRTFEQLLSLMSIQWAYRDYGKFHFYLGIAKSLLRIIFFPLRSSTASNKRGMPTMPIVDPPIYRWTPIRGVVNAD